MKKFVAIAVLGLASLSITACGSSEPSTSPSSMAKAITEQANKGLKDLGVSATINESCVESKLSALTADERKTILKDQAVGEAFGETVGRECVSTN